MMSLMAHTIMTLSFRTDRSGQTVQAQIRLLLEKQSGQGLHCCCLELENNLASENLGTLRHFSSSLNYHRSALSEV